MNVSPILFNDIQTGVVMGEWVDTYSEAQADKWQALFGSGPDAAQAASMATVYMMRAFLNVVAPRPPGNIHARQVLRMKGLPRLGETLTMTVACEGKEMRRERRYVDLSVRARGEGGRPIFEGLISLIWAA